MKIFSKVKVLALLLVLVLFVVSASSLVFASHSRVDLGTTNTLVFVPNKGLVVKEPSVVAISILDNKIIAVGNYAKEMIGRAPDSIIVSRPLRDGVIADYRITEAMLRYFITKRREDSVL